MQHGGPPLWADGRQPEPWLADIKVKTKPAPDVPRKRFKK
jgi:hypothetical protein